MVHKIKNKSSQVASTAASVTSGATKKTKASGRKVGRFIDRYPIWAFFIALVILFSLIVVGSIFRQPEIEEGQVETTPLSVSTYSIGESPKISVSGTVDKTGVVRVDAQKAGIVSRINVKPGQVVSKGTSLVSLSNTYTGASIDTANRQLSATQYQFQVDNYDLQKDTITTQRRLAEENKENSDELRKISNDSIEETENLIKINNDLIESLNDYLGTLTSPADDATINQTKASIAQAESGNNAAKSSLRNLQLNADKDKPPAQITNLSKDLTMQQLDLQEKTLDLNREVAGLSLRIAQINEAMMNPVSPFDAVVERVYVNPFDQVNPGSPLVMLSEIEDPASVVVTVPQSIANSVAPYEAAVLDLGTVTLSQVPAYISSEPTDGRLFSILFDIPDYLEDSVAIGQVVSVELPVGGPDTSAVFPFIPIDAVHQTQESAFIYVAQDDVAVSQEVELGLVQGSYVEIIDGLEVGDQVIVDRRVINGDSITVANQ